MASMRFSFVEIEMDAGGDELSQAVKAIVEQLRPRRSLNGTELLDLKGRAGEQLLAAGYKRLEVAEDQTPPPKPRKKYTRRSSSAGSAPLREDHHAEARSTRSPVVKKRIGRPPKHRSPDGWPAKAAPAAKLTDRVEDLLSKYGWLTPQAIAKKLVCPEGDVRRVLTWGIRSGRFKEEADGTFNVGDPK